MRKVWSIFKREAASYFVSPIAYVLTAVFLVVSGFFFTTILFQTGLAQMRYVFGNMAVTFLFVAPVIAMRTFAEEKKLGTYELLMTSPVTTGQIVLGKYLAAVMVYVVMLASTIVYPLILTLLGSPDMGPIYSGYLGLLLLGGVFLAVGVFASSLTENQVIAGMIGFSLLLLLWVIGWASSTVGGTLGQIINALAILSQYDSFEKGIIDSANVVYYLSFIFGFLFLTHRVIEARRWS